MKKILTLISGLLLMNHAQAQNPSIIIGGIEVKGFTYSEDVLRSVIYKDVVNTGRYTVNDRYDVAEKMGSEKINACMGKECLVKIGKELNAEFAMSASYDGLGDRILVSMKIVHVPTGQITKNVIEQFENQPREMNRITGVMIEKLIIGTTTQTTATSLIFKEGPAATPGLGKLNNNGPRIGIAVPTGQTLDFLSRSARDGGLESGQIPLLFNFGYQLEKQYAGSEKFSGLFEFIGNVSGLERAKPVPSIAILHGVRFGKGAWEIAVGPSITLRKELTGTTDFDGQFKTESQLNALGVLNPESYSYFTRLDNRGATYVSSNFVVGFGRTFRPGALNVPVNAYASMSKYGTSYGISMGINITKSRSYTQTYR